MNEKERVIRIALAAYPDVSLDVDGMTLDQIRDAAVKMEFGDTLLCFVVLELDDVLADDMTLVEARSNAAKALWRGVKDLTAVLDAIENPV